MAPRKSAPKKSPPKILCIDPNSRIGRANAESKRLRDEAACAKRTPEETARIEAGIQASYDQLMGLLVKLDSHTRQRKYDAAIASGENHHG